MATNRLCLGTVQFGMNYGINNKVGQPSKESVFKMMDIARDNDIDIFDTAAAYGTAEELLGEYIRKNSIGNKIKVISKLLPNIIEDCGKEPKVIIEEEIVKSLKKLNIDILDGYLLHTPIYFYNPEIMEELHRCKQKGYVNNIGVSIYDMKHALDAAASGQIDYIQLPYSIFDQRVDQTDFFKIAKENNVIVYARSAFLQGLILMKQEEIPEHLEIAKDYLKRYNKITQKYSVNNIEAAMHFVLDNKEVDYLVFGVDTPEQLIKDIRISQDTINLRNCIEEVKLAFCDVEKSVIFPSLWSKK